MGTGTCLCALRFIQPSSVRIKQGRVHLSTQWKHFSNISQLNTKNLHFALARKTLRVSICFIPFGATIPGRDAVKDPV